MPTAQDVVSESSIAGGIEAWDFEHRKSLGLDICDTSSRPLTDPDATKFTIRHSKGNISSLQLIDCFKYIDTIVHTFDLAEYAEISSTGSISNDQLRSSIETFASVVNCERVKYSKIILLLCNLEAFEKKLMKHPFTLYFPAYTGDGDVYSAIHYIMEQFRQTIRRRSRFCHHIFNLSDTCTFNMHEISMRLLWCMSNLY